MPKEQIQIVTEKVLNPRKSSDWFDCIKMEVQSKLLEELSLPVYSLTHALSSRDDFADVASEQYVPFSKVRFFQSCL